MRLISYESQTSCSLAIHQYLPFWRIEGTWPIPISWITIGMHEQQCNSIVQCPRKSGRKSGIHNLLPYTAMPIVLLLLPKGQVRIVDSDVEKTAFITPRAFRV